MILHAVTLFKEHNKFNLRTENHGVRIVNFRVGKVFHTLTILGAKLPKCQKKDQCLISDFMYFINNVDKFPKMAKATDNMQFTEFINNLNS